MASKNLSASQRHLADSFLAVADRLLERYERKADEATVNWFVSRFTIKIDKNEDIHTFLSITFWIWILRSWLVCLISSICFLWVYYCSLSFLFSFYLVDFILFLRSLTFLSKSRHSLSSFWIYAAWVNMYPYHCALPLFRIDYPSHTVPDAAFVESFVRLYLTSVLISHSHEKEPSLSAVDCYLPDDLVKTLVI